MRKLFLLIPLLAFALMASAKVLEIAPNSPQASDNVRREIRDHISAGDTLKLADGTYSESEVILFDKSVTVIAAEGAHPVIAQNYYSKITSGAKVKFIGITFDGSLYNSGAGAHDHCFCPYDASDGNEIRFENCEFRSFPSRFLYIPSGYKLDTCIFKNTKFSSAQSVVYNSSADVKYFKMDGCEVSGITEQVIYAASSASHMDSCIVNNCYFHENTKSAIYFPNSSVEGKETCDRVRVTNSTFANTTTASNSVITIYNKDYAKAATIKVIVDHCTFYNNTPQNTDHGVIRVYKSTDVRISNCIFAHPTSITQKATSCYGGTITNNLVYNYDYNDSGHRTDDVTPVGNIKADPRFADAANKDFTFPGNWSTGDISPARGTATDHTDLGDPRWYTAETLPLPTTNFASPYAFLGTKAQLMGSFALNTNDSIKSQDKSYDGIANWKFHAERPCYVQVTLNINPNNASGHRYEVELFDSNNALVGTSIAEAADSWSKGNQILGILHIPAVGDYKIKLTNHTNHSSTVINGITLSYMGGAVQALSTSADTPMPLDEAWFTGCSRDADGITFTGHNTDWIKWNISTSETKFYDLTLNVNASNAHGLTVAIYEDENAAPVASLTEGSFIETTGTLALELGRISLSGGKNFVVKVTNAPSGSVPEITSLVFAPFIPSTVNLPNTLDFANSVLSARAHLTDGKLYFAPIGDTNPVGEWARWSVATDHDGLYLFTMGVNSDNAQSYKITILDDGDNEVAFCDLKTNSGAQTLKHYFQLATGNYSVKVENTYAWSHGHLTSLVVTEPNTAITMSEEATDNSAWSAKVNDGINYDVQIIRTLRADMYNTFCLPFEVTPNEAKEIFGLDIEIYTLETAVVTDNVLYVTLNPASDIYPGTPVFIKPSHDIVNPIFDDVTFTAATPSATTKTNADFEGTFVKSSLEPNQNILYLGTDNTLYYPAEPTPIKGMRGWFVIHDTSSPAPAIRQMRIVEKTDTTTDITTVEESDNKAIKTITNGQLIIIRDGVRYNAMGIRIE